MTQPVLLCSTGAGTRYSSKGTDPGAILLYGQQLGVDLELLVDRSWLHDLDGVIARLGTSGLRFPVVHVQKEIGPLLGSTSSEEQWMALDWLEANCRLGSALGAHLVILHLWGRPSGDTHLERNLHQLSACIDIAARHRLALAVETIPCLVADPLTNVHLAIQQDERCLIALDTEFLAMYDQLATVFEHDWLWQAHRVRHIHIKDYDGYPLTPDGHRRYLHPGEGQIDFVHFFTCLKQQGYTGNLSLEACAFTSEQQADIHRLRQSLQFLRVGIA